MRKGKFVTLMCMLFAFIAISTVSAVPEDIPNTLYHPTNFSELPTVNASDYWITDIGALGTVNSAQFNNIGGTLTIDTAHFDLRWLNLDGSNSPTADINWGGQSLFNANNINGTGNIYMSRSLPGISLINAMSTNPIGLSAIRADSDSGAFASLISIGSQFPGANESANDSGIIAGGGRLIFVNNGDEDIAFAHVTGGGSNFSNASFTFRLEADGDALLSGDLFLENNQKSIRTVPINGGSSIVIDSNDTIIAGGFPVIEVARSAEGNRVVTRWSQNGRNNSFSGAMNSFGTVPNSWVNFTGETDTEGIQFLLNRSDYINYCDYLQDNLSLVPEGCKYFADTTSRLVPLLFGGDLEVHRSATIHEGLLVYDDFDFVTRDDNDFDISGGDGHITKTQKILSNVTFIDQSICDFNDGDICQFINVGTPADPVNQWNSKSSILCPTNAPSDEDCAGANGNLRIMEMTLVTLGSNFTNLSFYYTTAFSGSGSELYITMDDNQGNTTTTFSQTVGVANQEDSFLFPSDYLNKSNVTMSIVCDAKNNLNGCYVDDFRGVVTFTEPILINLTKQQGKWIFGEGGQLDECSVNVFWEIIENSTQTQKVMEIGCIDTLTRFLGNTSFVDTTVENQTVVGNSLVTGNLTVEGTISQNGSTLDETYFRLNGASVMAGNTNSSNYNATYAYIFGNGSQLTGLPETDLTGYAKYQFENNNFNGSGNFTTTNWLKANILQTFNTIDFTDNKIIMGDISGNARGSNSIDIQTFRTDDTQVSSGNRATSLGYRLTTASDSINVGVNSHINDGDSINFGLDNIIDGEENSVFGVGNILDGDVLTVIGGGNEVYDEENIVLAVGGIVDSSGGLAVGFQPRVYGDDAVSVGRQCTANGTKAVAIGVNINNQNPFTLEIGASNEGKMSMDKDGNTTIRGNLDVNGTINTTILNTTLINLDDDVSITTEGFSKGILVGNNWEVKDDLFVAGDFSVDGDVQFDYLQIRKGGDSILDLHCATSNPGVDAYVSYSDNDQTWWSAGLNRGTDDYVISKDTGLANPIFRIDYATEETTLSGNLNMTDNNITDVNIIKAQYGNFTNNLDVGGDVTAANFMVESDNIIATDGSIAIGTKAQATGLGSFASGYQSGFGDTPGVATGQSSIAFGPRSLASGDVSFAMGKGANALLGSSFAFGNDANASGQEAIALGGLAEASGSKAVAIGGGSIADSTNAIAIGIGADSLGTGAVAVGNGATSSAFQSVAIGATAIVSGIGSVQIGVGTNTIASSVQLRDILLITDTEVQMNIDGKFTQGLSKDVSMGFTGSAWEFDPQLLTPGIQMKVLGTLNVTENVITEDRYYLPFNFSIGSNSTCMIFYNQTGGIMQSLCP